MVKNKGFYRLIKKIICAILILPNKLNKLLGVLKFLQREYYIPLYTLLLAFVKNAKSTSKVCRNLILC